MTENISVGTHSAGTGAVGSGSVGIVAPKIAHFNVPLTLKSGAVLPQFDLVYETYGTLNADKSNAV